MAHGGYSNRRPTAGKPANNRRIKGPKTGGVNKKKSKPKSVSLKNQIRSTQRILAKDLPSEVKEAQQKKLGELKKQQDMHTRLAGERKTFLLDRKKKFFERRKIERRIRRLEKQQRVSGGPTQEIDIAEQLSKLKEDLEYVRFFPKNEKYVALFMGGDNKDTVDRRDELRKQIKANIIAAAASGKDLEETGSEDDGLLEPSEDDFFLTGSSSDEADADDELTDKSAMEQNSSTSGKAASGMSSDEKNQRQISARAFMLPPRPSKKSSSANVKSRFFEGSSSKKSFSHRPEASRSGNTSNSMSGSSFRNHGYSSSFPGNRNNLGSNSRYPGNINSFDSNSINRGHSNSYTSNSSNLSSNTEPQKPRRKRRPKKKKEQDKSRAL